MNTADERAKQSIPGDCRRCMHCDTRITLGVERHQCLRGYPMHPECGWQRDRTESIAGVRP